MLSYVIQCNPSRQPMLLANWGPQLQLDE